jgi:hypothetical protein
MFATKSIVIIMFFAPIPVDKGHIKFVGEWEWQFCSENFVTKFIVNEDNTYSDAYSTDFVVKGTWKRLSATSFEVIPDHKRCYYVLKLTRQANGDLKGTCEVLYRTGNHSFLFPSAFKKRNLEKK